MGKLFRGIFVFIALLQATSPLYGQPVKEIRATHLTYQRYLGETLSWKLKTEEFLKKGEDYFEAKNIYLENIPKGIKISAERGRYLLREDKFILTGRVRLYTEKEGEVYTEELYFFPKRDLIEAPGEVLIKKGSIEVKGEGLTYQVSLGDFKLHKRARAQFRF